MAKGRLFPSRCSSVGRHWPWGTILACAGMAFAGHPGPSPQASTAPQSQRNRNILEAVPKFVPQRGTVAQTCRCRAHLSKEASALGLPVDLREAI